MECSNNQNADEKKVKKKSVSGVLIAECVLFAVIMGTIKEVTKESPGGLDVLIGILLSKVIVGGVCWLVKEVKK